MDSLKRFAAYVNGEDPENPYATIELRAYVMANTAEEALEKAKHLPEESFYAVGAPDAYPYYYNPDWGSMKVWEE